MRASLLACVAAFSLHAQPQVHRFTLPNGLRVLHLEDHERPLVRARIHLRVEPSDTPPGRQGLPLLALRVIEHSDAADLKAEDFDRLLDGSGIQFAQFPEPDGLGWRLLARSRDQDRALGLLADRLLRTVFEPSALETQRLACWRDEERQEASPQARLREALIRAPGSRPTLASLTAITLEDLLAFRARVFRPDRAVLVLHGDLGVEQAKRLVFLSLGSWAVQEPPPPEASAPVQPAAPPEAPPRIPAPGTGMRIQAVAVRPPDVAPEAAALLGLLVPGDPALSPVEVAAEGNCLVATLDAEAGAAPSTLLKGRLEALRQRGFTQVDLDRARASWEAGLALGTLHPPSMLEAALAEALGRRAQEPRMKALSLAGLNAALRRWLDPARLRAGAAGDPEALKSLPTL